MATTVQDVKRANTDARRTSYEVTADRLRYGPSVTLWLRQLARLEAAIRRYAAEHNVEVNG